MFADMDGRVAKYLDDQDTNITAAAACAELRVRPGSVSIGDPAREMTDADIMAVVIRSNPQL